MGTRHKAEPAKHDRIRFRSTRLATGESKPMTTRKIIMMALAAGFMILGQAATATAQDVTYSVRNDHPNTVELEFYSADRDVAWPGGGNAFILDDGEPHSLPLACEEGERVCYGAWVQGDSSIT